MLLRKLLGALFLCSILVFGASAAFAAPFLPPEVQELEDQDFESLLNPDGSIKDVLANPIIEVGDLFAGVIKIQKTSNVTGPGPNPEIDLQTSDDTFTAIFLIKTATVDSSGDVNTPDNSFDELTFTSATAADWSAVFGAGGTIDLTPAGFDVTDLDGLGTGVATGTMAMMFDGVAYADAEEEFDPGTIDNVADSAQTFVDGARLLYEFGLTGAAGEFWETAGIDAAISTLAMTSPRPDNIISLNITQQWAGPDLDPHNFLGDAGDLNFTDAVQLQGDGSFQALPQIGNPPVPNSPWGLGTDTNFYIKPDIIPEPGTMLLLGFGLISLAGVTRRKS